MQQKNKCLCLQTLKSQRRQVKYNREIYHWKKGYREIQSIDNIYPLQVSLQWFMDELSVCLKLLQKTSMIYMYKGIVIHAQYMFCINQVVLI